MQYTTGLATDSNEGRQEQIPDVRERVWLLTALTVLSGYPVLIDNDNQL